VGFDFASPRAASAFAEAASARQVRLRPAGVEAGFVNSFFIIPTFFDYLYAQTIQESKDILIIFLKTAVFGGRA
jgi:hypothetical protein